MQDGIRTGGDPFDADLAGCWMEQGEQFGGPVLGVFVGLSDWLSFRLPMLTWIRDGLIRACFILRPDGQSLLLGLGVRLLDQVFFPTASGSVTRDWPTFSYADGLASVAPGAILLPRVAGFMQHT